MDRQNDCTLWDTLLVMLCMDMFAGGEGRWLLFT
jgi:hypothetical protein